MSKLLERALFRLLLFGLGLLSLFASVHADIFAQLDNPWKGFVSEPWRVIRGSEPIKLSELLQKEIHGGLGSEGASITATEYPPPLYIFGLDMSGSLINKPISEEEIAHYRRIVGGLAEGNHAIYCLDRAKRGGKWTGVAVASAELCRLLSSIPMPANVVLWAFGDEPMQVVPESRGQYGGARFLELTRPRNGEHPMRSFFAWIDTAKSPANSPGKDRTDIEAFLREIRGKYSREIGSYRQEVHIVIVSDFIHDIGGSDGEQAVRNHSEWESRYRASRQVIADHVRSIAGEGKMLHLVIFQTESLSFRNVLPILKEEGLDWAAVRESRVRGSVSSFDFLRSYRELSEPITFYHDGAGIEHDAVKILFDLPEYEGSELGVHLAADNMGVLPPLSVSLESAREGLTTARHYWGSIWPGREDYCRVMLRSGQDGDQLLLQPSLVLEPHEAERYRILMAWQGTDVQEESARVTFSIPVRYHRSLPLTSAYLLFVALAFSAAVLGGLAVNRVLWAVGSIRGIWGSRKVMILGAVNRIFRARQGGLP